MASGVKVAAETVQAYDDMKLKKKHRYAMFHIDDGQVKVLTMVEKDASKSQEEEYQDFLQALPGDIGRYCIVDLAVPQKNGAVKDKLFIITWCPDNASTKSNILYTTSKKALLDKVREGLVDMQANDLDDLNYKELMEKHNK